MKKPGRLLTEHIVAAARQDSGKDSMVAKPQAPDAWFCLTRESNLHNLAPFEAADPKGASVADEVGSNGVKTCL